MRWQLANSQPTDSSRLVDDHFHRLNDSYWLALARCRVRPMTSVVVFLVPLSLAGGDTLPLDLPSSTHRQRTTINEVWHFLTLLFFFLLSDGVNHPRDKNFTRHKSDKWVQSFPPTRSINFLLSFFLFWNFPLGSSQLTRDLHTLTVLEWKRMNEPLNEWTQFNSCIRDIATERQWLITGRFEKGRSSKRHFCRPVVCLSRCFFFYWADPLFV